MKHTGHISRCGFLPHSARLLPILLFMMLCRCSNSGSGDPRLHPAVETPPSTAATTRFEWLSPERTGINYIPTIVDEHRYNFIADPYIYNGGGVAVIDVNNDGLQDLFFTARLQGCRLYLNKGGMQFEDISEKSGVSKFSGLKTGVVTLDINADGWQDLYVCRTWLEPVPDRRNLLFVNNRDNTFSEQAAAYKLDDLSASQHANFFDYDLDGDLDCYIVNHPVDFKTMNNLDDSDGNAAAQPPRNEWESDRLLENKNGVFEDVTKRAGMLNRAYGLSSLAADFNGDGWPDLYVGNDFVMPDFLYINNRNGTFSNQADRYFHHMSNHTMGADLADLNGDGLGDLVSLDMLARPLERQHRLMNTMQLNRDKQMRKLGYGNQAMRNMLQINTGNGSFSDIGCLAGIEATDWSWAPLLADFDHDGRCDIFISNGIQRDLNDLDFFVFTADSINRSGGVSKSRFPDFNAFAGMMPSHPVHNYMFKRNGELRFEDVSEPWGFSRTGFSNGATYADLDNDGDLDLVTNNLQAPPSVYENQAVQMKSGNWLQIKCKGTAQNPFGLGSKVRVYGPGSALLFSGEMTNVRGFYSSVEPILQVGLGAGDKIDRVEIDWQENRCQAIENPAINRRLVINIADAKPGKNPARDHAPAVVFSEDTTISGLSFTHQENEFEDFDREKLLPYRLSQTGPGMTAGDVNGDGLEDVFIGGALGFSGAVFLQQSTGTFTRSSQPALEQDKDHEDTAAALLDADGDGDLDLFVVSGGNELPAGSEAYQDRLYLNDGKGTFSKSDSAVPKETNAGSCVRAADVNGDGKTDLVVGGRCIPGRFPEAANSMIWINEGGVFKDETDRLMPEFARCGMVTDLAIGDLNGDRRMEIVVVGDWMPVQVYEWKDSQYKKTEPAGLENSNGLWRSVTLADIDGDKDLDIVAGNLGLNTRFKASAGAPLRMFAADFDRNGSIDPVLAIADGGVYRPAFQREQLASQLPMVRKKFPRNAPYSKASIEQIIPEKDLLAGPVLSVQTLQTQWFQNNEGGFSAHPLPDYTQIAPAERILAADFNADGNTDILCIGNDLGMDAETYRLDASDGYLILGAGGGTFAPGSIVVGADKEGREALLLGIKEGKSMLLVANNKGPLQAFYWKSSKN